MDLNELLNRNRGRRSLLQALGVAAVGISFGGMAACSKSEGKKLANGEEAKLNFYNWDTYIGETTLDDFKGATGVDVTMDLFDSNDVLFAKFKAGNPGYDVIVPSNDFVERMAQANMLQALDHAQIPNIKRILTQASSTSIMTRAVNFRCPTPGCRWASVIASRR